MNYSLLVRHIILHYSFFTHYIPLLLGDLLVLPLLLGDLLAFGAFDAFGAFEDLPLLLGDLLVLPFEPPFDMVGIAAEPNE